jgi:N-acetyl-gamma-glutamyl-phosphate reductase
MIRIGILGASGYGGAGLLQRASRHPQLDIVAIGSRQYAGQAIGSCWPQLAGLFPTLTFEDSEIVIARSDVVFCATPHGKTAPLVKLARTQGKRVVDLSADFRLPMKLYAKWYQDHPHPELYPEARYGLVELHRQELHEANILAVPGCNSSAAILALAPLAAQRMLGPDIIINHVTGVSGAGRSLSLGAHFSELHDNFKPYKVAGSHRHIAEIELTLGRLMAQGKQLSTHSEASQPTVIFNPHLAPMNRGIMVTCSVRLREDSTQEHIHELYQSFYQADPLILVQREAPQTKAVANSDRTLISVHKDERSGMFIIFACIDNLAKGAAGQAIQGFNVMQGFDETLGLTQQGVWP